MLNIAVIMGRLTADPELRHTASGIAVTSFTLAVDRRVRAGEESTADFIDVVAWRQTAEFVAKYFKKGKMMAVDGRIQTRTYEDKTGAKRKAFEIIANNVSFADSNRQSDGSGGYGQGYSPRPAPGVETAPAPDATNADADDFSVILDGAGDLPF